LSAELTKNALLQTGKTL